MQPKSNNLFHFTRSLENLKGILQSGFLPRYSLEDSTYFGIDYVGYPMVCFCDIPISRIDEHTSFYGEYGLGMTKEWGLKNQLQPLLYTPPTGMLSTLVKFLFETRFKEDRDELKALSRAFRDQFFALVPMVKPISGTMVVAGQPVEKEFFQENEWRYVPPHDDIVFQDVFEERKAALNEQVQEKRLMFAPSDVRYIFVKSDFEIPQIFDFVDANLGQFPHNDIKILISRITSLETLSRDV